MPRSSDFQLELEADWSFIGAGERAPVRYTLTNRGGSTVCVGGFERLSVGRFDLGARVLNDALCETPVKVVAPGSSISWIEQWTGYKCLAEPAPGFAESFPELICGSKAPVRVDLALSRFEKGSPQWGGTTVTSRPVEVTITAGRARHAAGAP